MGDKASATLVDTLMTTGLNSVIYLVTLLFNSFHYSSITYCSDGNGPHYMETCCYVHHWHSNYAQILNKWCMQVCLSFPYKNLEIVCGNPWKINYS